MAQAQQSLSTGTFLRGVMGLLAAVVVAVPVAGFVLLKNLDLNSFKPKIEAMAFDALGRKVQIGGDIGIALSLTPTLTMANVTLANADWAGTSPLVSVGSASVKVDIKPLLEKRLQIREVLLDNVTLALAKNAKNVGNWELSTVKATKQVVDAKPSAQQNPLSLEVNHVQLSHVNVSYDDAQTKRHLEVQIPEAQVSLQDKVIANINLVSGEVNAKLQATSASLEELTKGSADVSLSVDGGDAHAKFDGTLKDFIKTQRFLFKVEAQAASLSAFNKLAGSPLPKIEATRLTASLSGTPSQIDMKNMQGSYGDIAFSGNVNAVLGGKVPVIKAQIKIPTLSLASSKRNEQAAQGTSSASAASTGRVIPDAPLVVPVMNQVNADVTLDIGEVKGDTPIKDIHSVIALHQGALSVKPLRFVVKNVPLSASLALKKQGSGAAVAFTLDGKAIALGTLLKELQLSNSLDGAQTDMSIQLSGAGDTIHHMLPTLTGSVMVLSEKGVYHGGASMQQSANFLQLLTGKGQSSDVTISCLATKMNVSGGVARPEWMVFETDNARVDGTGEMNLGTESLAFKLYPRAKKQGLSAITLPVKVVGTFAKPNVVPDAQASVAMLAKAALEIGGKGKNVAAISQSISQKFDVSAGASPCLSAPEPASAADTAESLKDLAKEKRGEIKEQVKEIKTQVKDIKQNLKDLKDLKDPEALGNTIENLKGLKLF